MDYDDQSVPPARPPVPPPPRGRPGYDAPPVPPPPGGGEGLWAKFFSSCMVAGCATILAPVLLVGGFMVVMFLVVSDSIDGAMKGSFSGIGEGAGANNLFPRTLRAGGFETGTIAVVTVQGAIDGSGSPLSGDGMMAFVSDQMRLAAEDDDVKGVILQIDSPGGGLTASDHLHHQVGVLRKTGKPVIAWAGSVMASGGYYIAVGAERIMASPTATVGSIGVILQHFQVAEMMRSLGIKVDPVTSGERKDLGSPFRDMTPEERKLLQDYVDVSHNRFVDIVAEGRKMPRDAVAALADGSIMGAEAALEKGLIDSIGYIEDAVALLESELGETDMRVIGYSRRFSLADALSEAGAGAAAGAIREVRNADVSPKAMAVYGSGGGGFEE